MGKLSTEGIVVKVTEDKIVLLCPNGAFKNIARAAHNAPPLLGEQYVHVEKQTSWLKYVSVAAVFFLAIMAYTIFQMTAPTSSYVLAIDINPSLELVLNEKMEVEKATGYNEEAVELLSTLKIENLVLAEAYQKIIEYSYEKGYLTSDNSYVETAIIPLKKQNKKVIEKIEETIKISTPQDVVVTVTQNNSETYQDAKDMQVSVNKLTHLKELKNDGVIESVQAAKGKSVSELRKMQKDLNKSEESQEKANPNKGKGNGNGNQPEPPGLNKDKKKNNQPSMRPANPAAEKKGDNSNKEKSPGNSNNPGQGNNGNETNKGNPAKNNDKGNNKSGKGNNDKGNNPGKGNNSNNSGKGNNQGNNGSNPGKGNPGKGNN
ncbi:hypothetical protein DS745_09880 [Anaerobacillus alkaliphilus]|uniref:RsgI N-terminal anti-sigma domain-containing protein n=2 Tax=Anaerobacillus alkaliphilus TaxID=1548597 RepID=A0A4Q0VT95_9BACI|nr:hypothetical protein DS745_09880 [Anaerobacillus alkaliphilus]